MGILIKVILVFFMYISLADANDIPDFPFILASGQSDVNVKPDIGTISLELIEFNKDAAIASKVINDKEAAIVKFATENGIPLENITFNQISKNITRSQNEKSNQLEILGYEISQILSIKFDTLDKYPKIAGELISLPNVRNVNATFDTSKRDKISADLIKASCEKAKVNAANLAVGLNVKLGNVFAITQGSDFSVLSGFFGGSAENMKAWVTGSMQSDQQIQFIPKSISIEASVKVVYKISDLP